MLAHSVRGHLDRTTFWVLGTMSCEFLETKKPMLADVDEQDVCVCVCWGEGSVITKIFLVLAFCYVFE